MAKPENASDRTLAGKCFCGNVHYAVSDEFIYAANCHCSDCRRHAGAPVVGWAAYPATALTVTGETRVYASSEHGRRHFCPECGTGLFYYNEVALPGMADIQSATFDDPEAHPPQLHVQFADHLAWMDGIGELPKFARYPGQEG